MLIILLFVFFLAAKLGARLARSLGQAEVLGELLAGLLLSAINVAALLGVNNLSWLETIIAPLGVILLLFEVGLETSFESILKTGWRSLLVAIVGVIAPFCGAYFFSFWILPELTEISRIFLGATLTATSVGITARVFKDMKVLNSTEAQIVLGAAVIDDVIGLMILAIVSGLALGNSVTALSLTVISSKAIGFLVLSLSLGRYLIPKILKLLARFRIPGLSLFSALGLMLLAAILAHQAGLAEIVGAFCMGLILEEEHFDDFLKRNTIAESIRKISQFLIPIFFILTAYKINFSVFNDSSVLQAAFFITVIAIVGKVISAWSFVGGAKVNRLMIGLSMIPRGEVGLIFATSGRLLGVVDDKLYAITVIMVLVTTFVTPIFLKALPLQALRA